MIGIGVGIGDNGVRCAASLSNIGSRVCVIGTSLVNQQSSATSTTIRRTAQSWMDWASGLSNGFIQFPIWNDPTVLPGWEPSGVGSVGEGYAQLDITTTGAAGDSLFYFRTNAADTTHTFADEWLISKCLIEKLTSNTCVKEVRLMLDDRGTAGIEASDGDVKDGYNFPEEAFAKLFSTPHNRFAGDSTAYRWRIEVLLDNSIAETVTIKINQPLVQIVEDPIVRYGSIT